MIAPPHRPIASSKSSAPQLKSRRITAARPFIGLLLLCAARQAHAASSPAVPDRQAHAVSSPAVPDHSQSGAPQISDAKSVGRALSRATCTDLDDGVTDKDGYDCGMYGMDGTTDDCGGWDDTDFSSNTMCCACGGGLAPLSPPAVPLSSPMPPLPPSPPSPPLLPQLQPGSQYASSPVELLMAVRDSSINRIVLLAGIYELYTNYQHMCHGSHICIDRALTIEAEVPGAVVLNAMGEGRVLEIRSAKAKLIGLNITGGAYQTVLGGASNPNANPNPNPNP